MKQIELDIISDLTDLEDTISQYTYLIECAKTLSDYPEIYKTDAHIIPECQSKTWLFAEWQNGKLTFLGDSESFIIKGALALLIEIYHNRLPEEVNAYSCNLIHFNAFRAHFTRTQLEGISSIISRISTKALI